MLGLVAQTFSVISRGFEQNQLPFNYHTTEHGHKGIITYTILLLFKKMKYRYLGQYVSQTVYKQYV